MTYGHRRSTALTMTTWRGMPSTETSVRSSSWWIETTNAASVSPSGSCAIRHDAEDQVQNAFALALEHLNQFRYGAKFSSWLGRIVINQCRMRFREMQRTRSVGIADDWDQPRDLRDQGHRRESRRGSSRTGSLGCGDGGDPTTTRRFTGKYWSCAIWTIFR